MLLSDFFNYLTYGELSQMDFGGEEIGEVTLANYPNIISNVNAGLIELYKRFPLSVKKEVVTYVPDQENYTLTASDLLVVEKITNEAGESYPFNDANNEISIFQTSFNTISIPFDINNTEEEFADTDTTVTVVYKAAPARIPLDTTDATSVTLPITDQYLEPLLNYVTYRIFSGINANNPDTVNYYNKFEAACALLRNVGMFHKDAPTNLRLENNGWL